MEERPPQILTVATDGDVTGQEQGKPPEISFTVTAGFWDAGDHGGDFSGIVREQLGHGEFWNLVYI